jgi:succinate dehydrogenase / fumarate reductase, cytochrome b subunit
MAQDGPQGRTRPKSPHVFAGPMKLHYSWGPHMTVSILNRVMGVGLATVGLAALVWGVVALGMGKEAYAIFRKCATSWYGLALWVALSFAFFLHMLAGLRHFILDAGAGFELVTNKKWAWGTMAGAVLLTALYWLAIYWRELI